MKRFKITTVETIEKNYTIIARDYELALDRLDEDNLDTVKQLDWHIADKKEENICECGQILPEGETPYCDDCILEMNERHEEEERQKDKREDRYDESRGH